MRARRLLAVFVSVCLSASPACAAVAGSSLKASGGARALPAPLGVSALQPLSSLAPLGLSLEARPVEVLAADPPAAASALRAVAQAAVPAAGAPEPEALNRAWDAQRAAAGAAPVPAGSVLSSTPGPTLARAAAGSRKPARPAGASRFAAGSALAPLSALAMPRWLQGPAAWLEPYLLGAGVLAGTWVLQKLVRWTVDRLAKRGKWNPNTTDTVRFIATLSSWLLGAGVGLALAGSSPTTIAATFGIAITLAIRKTVSNLVQAVILLVNRPFVIGEKVRIGKAIYRVEDMELTYVKMRVLGRLVEAPPAKLEAGVVVKPLAEVDPLGRSEDENGNKFALVRERLPGPQSSGETGAELAAFKYTQLSDKAITLFRPYAPDFKKREASRLKAALDQADRPFGKLWDSIKQTPRGSLLKPALWMIAAAALIPAAPLLEGRLPWSFVAAAMPYLQGLAVIFAVKNTAGFAGRLIPILFNKFGRTYQASVVARLLAEVAIWGVGLSVSMRVIGLDWSAVVAGLGVTAAAMTVATTDVLNNFTQAALLRLNRPFNIGDTIRIGTDVGVVQEMGMFYVVLKTAEGLHTMVPYGVIDASELGTYQSETK